TEHYRTPLEAARFGVEAFGMVTASTLHSFLQAPSLVVDRFTSPDTSGTTMMSLVGAAQVTGNAATTEQPMYMLALILVSINVSLGVFNLLPLPPLDGGHVAMAAVQGIRNWRARRRGAAEAPPSAVVQK